MKTRSLLFAGIVAGLLSSPAQATTTLYKFCSDSADDSEYADNRASATSAGWIIYDPGPDSTSNDGTFSHPIRLKNSTYVTTPTYADGWAITKVIVGARSTNLARVYHVNPSVGSEQTQTLTQTGVRQELEFDFDSSEGVTSVTITTPSGTGNSYLYDVTITILKPLSTPANLALVGDEGENEFTVSWDSVSGVSSYSVTLLDALGGTVDTQSRTPSQTTATFSGLTSSTAYTVSVVAVGDGTTYDDSVAATLPVETAASAIAAPTLVVSETQWTAGVAGTSAVSATLAGGESCAFASVEMSDGSSATVDNGILSWTPPASTTASSVTATFHVTHGTDGWDVEQVLSVAATPAPSAPVIQFSNATYRSFDASWSASASGPVAEYKVRAWSGRATPDDDTGGASENFASYASEGTIPAEWTFDHAAAYTGSTYAKTIVGFKSVSGSAVSPDFGGSISSLSFELRSISANGSFSVSAAPSGTDNWTVVTNYTSAAGTLKTEFKSIALNPASGFSKIKFEFSRSGGSAAFGTFSVSGVNWPVADFLEGWGGAKVSVGAATSQTFTNPVAGTPNYVEVMAIGPTGLTATTISSVAVPRPSTVISVW